MKKTFLLTIFLLLSTSIFSQQQKTGQKTLHQFYQLTQLQQYLNQLEFTTQESQYLIKSWVFIDKIPSTPEKLKLKKINKNTFAELLDSIAYLSANRSDIENTTFKQIRNKIDTLKTYHYQIMKDLNKFEAYDNPLILFEAQDKVYIDGDIEKLTRAIIEKINILKVFNKDKINKVLHLNGKSEIVFENDEELSILNAFISHFGINEITSKPENLAKIFRYFSVKELKDAIDSTVPKNKEFYRKYNKLIWELTK